MIEESGRVIALEQPGMVWVETVRKSSCGSCASEQSCGTGVISKAMAGKRSYVKAITDILDLQTGEDVIIGVPEDFMVRGTMRLYLLPLLLMMASMLVANQYLHYGDAGSLLFAVIGLGVGLLISRIIDQLTPLSKRDHPRVLQRGHVDLVRICDVS